MKVQMLGLGLAAMLVACGGKESLPSASQDDTSSNTADDTDTEEPCETAVVETTPQSGQTGVYYRDSIEVVFDDDGSSSSIVLYDPEEVVVEAEISWGDGNLKATITPTDALEASTAYMLEVEICQSTTLVAFETDDFGSDLDYEPEDLIGLTFNFDLGGADYEEPEGLGAVIGLYLSQPLLIGVTDASADSISLLGAQGIVDDVTAEVTQDEDFGTWDFGAADFTSNPYFSSDTDEIIIDYNGYEIPIYYFQLKGTFSSDATSIGGGHAEGLADSRNMGPLIEQGDDPNAVCELADSLGLECEACPDGEVYCMTLIANFDEATLEPGLMLTEI
mgnify:CR=1 FL=1